MIPVDVDDVTPAWLSDATGLEVTAVEVLDRHSGTTGRARVGLEYAPGAEGPPTVFVKLAPFDPGQRDFVTQAGLGIAEARFYAEVAPEVPVRVPACLASEWDDAGRFAIVLEDLGITGCRFPRPRDEDIAETAGRIVEELARLHAHFWADPRLTGELGWVAEGGRVQFGRSSAYVPLALERFGDELGPAFRRLADLYVAQPREIAAVLGSGTPTLIHGDAHLGNLFVDVAAGGRPGFFDWAMLWRASGLRDVAYVLGNSIPTEVRREGQREWIGRYVAGLAAAGVVIDEADAWEQYRVLAVYSWASATATAAMGSLWQAERIGQGGMRRATATIEDLDSLGALEAALARA
ncbi:MAG: phosphotransferase [Acidimicrobiia bacterium]